MPRKTTKLFIAVLLACFFIVPWRSVIADIDNTQSVGVSATVISSTEPINPIVRFTGIAAPSAGITVTRDGTTVGSQTATTRAAFDLTLNNQLTGVHIYVISGTDISGRTLAPVAFSLDMVMGSTTIITGVFLGPSIALDKSSVRLGQYITVSGATSPDSAVSVRVSSASETEYQSTSGDDGAWSKKIDTTELGVGTHTVYARSVSGGTQVSQDSATLSFSVDAAAKCDGKKTADLNCDGKVNLTDFSIMMFYWAQSNPANARVDINADGRVDVVDFSIMLYQWTS